MIKLPRFLKVTIISLLLTILFSMLFFKYNLALLGVVAALILIIISISSIKKMDINFKMFITVILFALIGRAVYEDIFLLMVTIVSLLISGIYLILNEKKINIFIRVYVSVILGFGLLWTGIFTTDLSRMTQLKDPIFARVDNNLTNEVAYQGLGYRIYMRYEYTYLPSSNTKIPVQGLMYLGERFVVGTTAVKWI